MSFEELVKAFVPEELRANPTVRFFIDRVVSSVWDRAKIRAGSEPGRLTGIPFLKRVVRRHIGESPIAGITVRSGVGHLIEKFIAEEAFLESWASESTILTAVKTLSRMELIILRENLQKASNITYR